MELDKDNENGIDIDTENEENVQLFEQRNNVRDKQQCKYLDMNTNDENQEHPFQIVSYLPKYNEHIVIKADYSPSNFCWRCKVRVQMHII